MPDPIVVRAVLTGHVVAGVLALLIAPVAMVVQKGGRAHRRWGKVYFWAMCALAASAIGVVGYRLATERDLGRLSFSLFLLFISILSFYSVFTAYRGLRRKHPASGRGPSGLDWGAAVVAIVSGAGFVAWGVILLFVAISGLEGSLTGFAWIAIILGAAQVRDAGADVRSFLRPPADRQWWWYYHMERMLGSYIAAVTAFLVQNVGRQLPIELSWIVWIAPAVAGSPLIAWWIAHYRRKFTRSPGAKGPTARPIPAVSLAGEAGQTVTLARTAGEGAGRDAA